MSEEGTTLWAVRGGGAGADKLAGVAVDSAGGVVGVGHFTGSATFGGTALVSAGSSSDAVVWKVGE